VTGKDVDAALESVVAQVFAQRAGQRSVSVLRPTLVSRIALLLVLAALGAFMWFAQLYIALAVVLGVGVLAWIALAARSITIDGDGLRARSLFGTRTLPWTEVEDYTYWSASPRRMYNGDLRIAGSASAVTVRQHELIVRGKTTRIRIHTAYRGAPAAIAQVIETIHVLRGGTSTFTPFAITDAGLQHRQDTLAWTDLEKVTVDAQVPPRLKVFKHGKAFPWKSEKLGDVDNGLLLLERLTDRGIEVDLGPQQLAHDALLQRMAARAAMPAARVVKRS
jgi:hypothetical protein